jgi:hypothetical protein
MMIIRIILAGSSALSSRSVTLAAMMSRVREKIPMYKGSLRMRRSDGPGCGASTAGKVPMKVSFFGSLAMPDVQQCMCQTRGSRSNPGKTAE